MVAQVCLYAFDCLYLNGEALIQKPLTERRAALYSALAQKEGELMWASTKVRPLRWLCRRLPVCVGPLPHPTLTLTLTHHGALTASRGTGSARDSRPQRWN